MKQTHYLVTWSIDIWADSPLEAAGAARHYQKNHGSIATIFDVEDVDNGKSYQVDGTEVKEIP